MPKVNIHYIYALIFTLAIVSGVVIFRNQSKPIVLSDEDFDGFVVDEPDIPEKPIPNPVNDTSDKKYYAEYQKSIENYDNLNKITKSPDKITLESYISIKKSLVLTEARYRKMIHTISLLIKKIEVENESGSIGSLDRDVIRAMVRSKRDELSLINTAVNSFSVKIVELDEKEIISLDEFVAISNQINNSLSQMVNSLVFVIE